MAETGSGPETTADTAASSFALEIVTPERQLVSEEVEAVRAPGIAGEFGVLPSHVRMVTGLSPGLIRYRPVGAGQWGELAVSAGLVEVLADRVIILAQTAEQASAIDLNRAEAALERARQRLENPDDDTDIERALEAVQRATVRVQAAKDTLGQG